MKKTFILSFFLSLMFSTSYAEPKTAIPVGETIGISLLTDGLLVTGTQEIECENADKKNPAENAGIKKGDRLISADGNKICSSEWLKNYVCSKKNDIVLSVNRNGESFYTVITPAEVDGEYRLGLWVKDSIAGIGTITFILPDSGIFGALGHGICDSETGILLNTREGSIISCELREPKRGVPGTPGELQGNFSGNIVGEFNKNTSAGIFGCMNNPEEFLRCNEIPIASSNEISEGKATILSDVDGLGTKEYEIEILNSDKHSTDGKNMSFVVTDQELIEKTGGILQGMSGSPILQNGKLVGAVTHVFVNDPTRGYGIFIKNMLEETAE